MAPFLAGSFAATAFDLAGAAVFAFIWGRFPESTARFTLLLAEGFARGVALVARPFAVRFAICFLRLNPLYDKERLVIQDLLGLAADSNR